jgi:hypothetical protein
MPSFVDDGGGGGGGGTASHHMNVPPPSSSSSRNPSMRRNSESDSIMAGGVGGSGSGRGGGTHSQRNSSALRTMSFFRNIIGYRNDDYRSNDVLVQDGTPVVTAGRRGGPMGYISESTDFAGAGSTDPSTPLDESDILNGTLWLFFARVIYSSWWKAILITMTVVMLFGAQVRDLWLPSAADNTVDGIFILALVVFISDIMMRIYTEPFYFALHCGKFRYQHQHQIMMQQALQAQLLKQQDALDEQHRLQVQQEQEALMAAEAAHGATSASFNYKSKRDMTSKPEPDVAASATSSAPPSIPQPVPGGCNSFGIGSFFFWCDLISTATLFFEISFIFTSRFDVVSYEFMLDSFGIPVCI